VQPAAPSPLPSPPEIAAFLPTTMEPWTDRTLRAGIWQLFNVVEDPGEAKDLSKAMPDKLKTLQAAWDRYAKEVGVVLPE
jgi:arylsulfatase A-like enzyme